MKKHGTRPKQAAKSRVKTATKTSATKAKKTGAGNRRAPAAPPLQGTGWAPFRYPPQ